ncbi:MAG: internalization-related competence protein ComEC/Rec2 [Hydrocarboniphaga sp.]|uniref:DNA internalization-related competence protein ComEC/Rec2 n=1 Tax=Hydrocarboniphaga sp. TaxID=2033016 RepID=UPI00262F0999|nr:DNA internalization-related competence protein ComEC/Rec2 [Hydrocarboniphaga sp.]MDB5967710.1 internalization-related competence protein ComEC/Rec2 [Hydrocarboniphaga sp.]
MDAGRRPSGAAGSPYLLAALFTAGVLIVHALPVLPALRWLLLAAIPALLPWRGRAAYAVLYLGAIYCFWRADTALQTRWPASRHGEERVVIGHVASLPQQTPGKAGDERLWRFQFQPADAALPLMRTSWYRSTEMLRAGECWQLSLRLRMPHGSMNPNAFDYEGWLFRQGIAATATVRDAERCEGSAGPLSLRWRQGVLDRMRAWLPDHPGLPLLAALTLGDDSGLSSAEWDSYRLTGTSHLIAVSGFNVAIIAGFGFYLGRWLWSLGPALCLRLPAQKAGMLMSALVGLAYAFAAGWEPPVQRAALMLLFLLGAAWFDRLRHPSRVLALAWIAVLLLDPLAVMAPGLWLSFAAVATIFYITSGRLKTGHFAVEALRVQIALTLSLIPLSLFFFQGLSWATAPINLIAVPVVAVLTPIALLALCIASLWPAAGVPLLGVTASALSELQRGLNVVAEHAAPAWFAASPPPAALVLASFGLLLLLAPRGLPLRVPGLLCLLPLLMPPQPAPAQGFDIAVLDVGQGLSVVVRTAHHVLLYDAGPAFDEGFDAGESIVVPYLLGQGLRRLDRVVISHADQDHIGGLKAVRRLLGIDSETGAPDRPACRDGLGWDWDGVHFEFLHPDGGADWTDNDGSCVLAIGAAPHRLLLTGDIEAAAERRLIDKHAPELRSEVLVAPHHGSRSSSGADFVAAVHPRLVIYGAAWRSHFGHPRAEVTARYAAIDARQYVTGVSGALLLQRSGEDWQVTESRRRDAHWWNAAVEP